MSRGLVVLVACVLGAWAGPAAAQERPNIILCMTDDQGVADAGFMGHPALATPHLDALAARGMVLANFYAQSPVCSPTRASCLTGMHPYRLGITGANTGHMPDGVTTLAELLRAAGYATGHFGKWHLGTLTTEVRDSNRGGRAEHDAHYAPPWDHGFEVCFSTEAKVPTAEPMVPPETGEAYGTRYWVGPGQVAAENLAGDDSRVIMDRVAPFVEACAERGRPFLAVVWFHSPHLPLVALPEDAAPYAGRADAAYLGVLSAVDREMGRLWETLERAGVAGDTLLLFCSDNGPERLPGEGVHAPGVAYAAHPYGSAGAYRGRKRSLHDGGLRTPAFAVWPSRIAPGGRAEGVACTTDFVPTICAALGLEPPEGPLDGVSILPMLLGEAWRRGSPVRFVAAGQRAVIDWPHKLIASGSDGALALYDLAEDPGESRDLVASRGEVAAALAADLDDWLASVQRSRARLLGEQQ